MEIPARFAFNTGGPLNDLCNWSKCNAPHKSVPVTRLVAAHRPHSADAIAQLIGDHVRAECACGCRSQGTVSDFAGNLFAAQTTNARWRSAHPDLTFTRNRCYAYMRELFCDATYAGVYQEA